MVIIKKIGLLLVAAFMAATRSSAIPQEGVKKNVFASCEDFTTSSPFELEGRGTTNIVMAKISCDLPVVVHVTAEAVLWSEVPLNLSGVHLVVHPLAKLTIHAPEFSMKRAEGSSLPVITAKGSVNIVINSGSPVFFNSDALAERSGIVKISPVGSVVANFPIGYSKNAIVSATLDGSNTRTKTRQGQHDLRPRNMVEELSTVLETVRQARSEPTFIDTAVPKALAASHRQSPSLGMEADENRSRDVATAPGLEMTPPTADTPTPDSVGAVSSSSAEVCNTDNANDEGSSSHDDGIGGSSEQPTPTALQVHPTPSLKVGQRLTGKLASLDGTSFLHPSSVDASLIFETNVGAVSANAQGPEPPASTVILAANPKLVARVRKLRADVARAEITEVDEQGGILAKVSRYLPFGKDGFRQRRARENLKAHLGETSIAISKRGIVEGSMDGQIVYKKAMGSKFGFLPVTDPSYELWATAEGVQVTRQGVRRSWGITADDIMD